MIRNDSDPNYFSVGGCVAHRESLEEAVVREVWEETGWKFEVERLVLIHENFFQEKRGGVLDGLNCHELPFYFLMKCYPSCVITSISKALFDVPEHPEWLIISKLNEMDMPVYPTFFANELLNLPLNVKYIVTYESDF